MDANIFATAGVQLVPDGTRQSYASLRWIFPHGKEWRCLSSILRLDRSRHYLRNPNSEDSRNKQNARGARQYTRNSLCQRAQTSIKFFETELFKSIATLSKGARK